jgi:hypothetical protein
MNQQRMDEGPMGRQAYTSTVVAPVQVGLAAGFAAALAVVAALTGRPAWPITVMVCAVLVAVGVHLGTVRLAVDGQRVLLGPSLFRRRPRVIDAASVVESHSASLGWAQVFGIGAPLTWKTTRLTIRPGPTLCLTLRDGERIRISTRDPDAAQGILRATTTDLKRKGQP